MSSHHHFESDSLAVFNDNKYDEKEKVLVQMPMIPTRKLENHIVVNANEMDEIPSYYIVQSPRESKGVAGPFTVNELRERHEIDEINGQTLIWKGGNESWHQLRHMPYLYPRVQPRPKVPDRLIENNILSIAALQNDLDSSLVCGQRHPLVLSLSRTCEKCGAFATVYTPGSGAQLPPVTASSIATCLPLKGTSEIIPGFLWVGNAGSGKVSSIETLGITLVINCTENIKTPASRPPLYRCHRTPMKEWTPDVNPTDFPSKEEILKTFSAVYDYIDWERLHSERAKESDIIHMKNKAVTGRYTGPVDKKGRTKIPMVPVRTVSTALTGNRFVDDENQRQRDMVEVKLEPSMKGNGPIPPARVLIWSRLGHDRPCALAAAYLIKCWGINLDKALSSMQTVRGGLKISEPYLQALQSWEDLYAMGASYCEDCIDHVSSRISMMKQKQLDIDTYPILKDGSVERNDIYGIKNYEEKDEKHSNNIYMKFELQMYSEDSEYEQKAAFGLTESFLSPSLGGMKQQGDLSILDLKLGGRVLGDEKIIHLFQALASSELLWRLKEIVLQGNELSCVGVAAICDSYLNQKGDMGVLQILNLSHNFIQSAGAERIGKLLRRLTGIEVFDISGNRLEDYGCTVIAETLIENPPEFIDDEEDVNSDQRIHRDEDLGLGYNRSLSALYLRDSDLGPLGVKALTDALERNKTLSTLNLEYNPLMTSESIKELMSIVSLNNHTLSRLSLAENPLTVKTLGYVLKAFEGKDVVLAHLDLSNCSLTSKHMSLFCKYGSCSCQYSDPNCSSSTHSLLTKLVSLNLTGNRFSDSGCFSLSSFLSGSSGRAEGIFKELEGISNSDVDDKSEFLRFSLRSLDLTDCAITSLGATAIFEAISTNTIFKRSSLVHLDLSDNPLGPGTFAPLPQKPTRKGSVINRRDSWLVALVQARVRDLTEEDSQSLAIVNHAVSFSTPTELQPYGVATDIDVSKEALDRSECLQYLSCCSLLDLRLNRTNLCVESAISLFKVLGSVDKSFTGVSTLGRTLKALSLVSNNLYDGRPIIKTLVDIMSNNHTLELLDIGFNGFTSDMLECIKGSLLLSDSHLKRRMSPLTVNVIGNKCEPYAVNVPLRHATLQYGLSSNSQSAYSGGGDIDRWTNISASILDRDEDGQTPALLPNIESDTLKSLALQSDLSHIPLDGKNEYLQRKIYLKAFNRDQAPPPSLSHTS